MSLVPIESCEVHVNVTRGVVSVLFEWCGEAVEIEVTAKLLADLNASVVLTRDRESD